MSIHYYVLVLDLAGDDRVPERRYFVTDKRENDSHLWTRKIEDVKIFPSEKAALQDRFSGEVAIPLIEAILDDIGI